MATRAEIARLLDRLEGPVREAFERAILQAQRRANIAAMTRAIDAGNMEALLRAAGIREGMWSALTEELRTAYMKAGIFTLADDLPKRFFMDFDVNNPRAENWLRVNSSRLITGDLAPAQRSAIQEILEAGMARGQNPTTTALDIAGRTFGRAGVRQGGVLGLTGEQASYVKNARDDLANLNSRYFDRRLRDRRFDAAVKRSFKEGKPLPKATRDKIVARYESRLLKHRADTVARTEVLASVNEASDEALRQAVDEGLAPANAVIRIWRHSFSLNERPGHLRMDGQERGIDEAFTNPFTGAVLIHPGAGPASEVINCRCYLEHKIDFAAVERARAA